MRRLVGSEQITIKPLELRGTKAETACIKIRNLKVNYGSIQALKNINITIKEGDFLE